MSKQSHTPGPWRPYNNPVSNYGLEVIADVKLKAKRVVCRVSGPDREANARLLAAAPELLSVLKAALSEWQNQMDGDTVFALLGTQMAAAIARAEGSVPSTPQDAEHKHD